MRIGNRTALAFLLSAGMSLPAFAADQLAETTSTSDGPSWTGIHIGVHAGLGMGNVRYRTVTPFPPSETNDRFADTFIAYGVHAGLDYQLTERWVIGLEGEFTNFGSDYTPYPPNPTLFWANWEASVSGRVGYLVTPQTLFYGRLGASMMDVEAEEGIANIATGTVTSALLGIGAETFIGGNWTGRLEANYVLPVSDFNIESDGEFFSPSTLLIQAGLSYRFGADRGSSFSTPAAPDISWTGAYAGVYGSFSHGSTEREIITSFATVGPFGADGFGLGGFAGYNFQFAERYVAGIEAEAAWQELDFKDSAGDAFTTPVDLFATVQGSMMASVRLGWLASPGTLLYAKGGVGGLLVDANEEFFPLDGGGQTALAAYSIGAGIESAITDHVSIRFEGLYTEALDHISVTNTQEGQVEIKPSTISARLGLAYRF